MALLTFLIHVSSARLLPLPALLGNLAGKLTPQFLYLFSRLREALPFYLFHASIASRRLVRACVFMFYFVRNFRDLLSSSLLFN